MLTEILYEPIKSMILIVVTMPMIIPIIPNTKHSAIKSFEINSGIFCNLSIKTIAAKMTAAIGVTMQAITINAREALKFEHLVEVIVVVCDDEESQEYCQSVQDGVQ